MDANHRPNRVVNVELNLTGETGWKRLHHCYCRTNLPQWWYYLSYGPSARGCGRQFPLHQMRFRVNCPCNAEANGNLSTCGAVCYGAHVPTKCDTQMLPINYRPETTRNKRLVLNNTTRRGTVSISKSTACISTGGSCPCGMREETNYDCTMVLGTTCSYLIAHRDNKLTSL
jgi:hypothetical protein